MSAGAAVREGLFDLEADGSIRLIAGRCTACAALHFPATGDCPYCSAAGCRAERLSGSGTVWAATVVHAAPPGYSGPVPYGFGVVELAEGLQVVTRLATGGELVPVGTAVRVVADPVGRDESGNERITYAFAPV